MLNRLILSVKTAGLNHKQIAGILIGGKPDQTNDLEYPLMRIFPNGSNFTAGKGAGERAYKITVAICDRHQDNNTSAIDSMSDCDSILDDIVASLIYMYRGDVVSWEINDSVESFYDDSFDVVAGVIVTLTARVPYKRNFCEVPSRNFDFPSLGLLAVSVIDEGNSQTIYTSSNMIDGGIA